MLIAVAAAAVAAECCACGLDACESPHLCFCALVGGARVGIISGTTRHRARRARRCHVLYTIL